MNELTKIAVKGYGLPRVVDHNATRIRRLVVDAFDRRCRRRRFHDWSAHRVMDFGSTAVSMRPQMYTAETFHEASTFALLDGNVTTRRLYPGYTYPPPDHTLLGAVGDAAAAYERNRREYPAGVEVREAVIDEALVFGDAVHLRSRDRVYALYESARANDRPALATVTGDDLRFVRELPDHPDTVFIGSPGSRNYGHWLTDDLPRAVATVSDASTRWVMTDHGTLINLRREESLRLALGDPSIHATFVPHNRAVMIRNLRYASPPSLHPSRKSPAALADVRARITSTMSRPMPTSVRRLYILRRGGASGRRIVNSSEIDELLARRGFATLDPLHAGAREQAEACFHADVIIGMMGAAMTNAMFARPGTTVIHLAASGWGEPYYADLAAACDHRYLCVYGPTAAEGSPWLVPFRIDVRDVEHALDLAGV